MRPEKKDLKMVTKLPDGTITYNTYELGFNRGHDLFTKHIEETKPAAEEIEKMIFDWVVINVPKTMDIWTTEIKNLAQAIHKRLEEI